MKTTLENAECVWMTSQIVDYKLCDRAFDCEHCQFDSVMRNRGYAETLQAKEESSGEGTDIIDRLLNELMQEHQHKRSIYLPNNLVVDELLDHSYRLSLSSLSSRFMDNVFSVVPCRQGEQIRKGQACITLSGAWGGITITSPIHFFFRIDHTTELMSELPAASSVLFNPKRLRSSGKGFPRKNGSNR